MLSNLIEIISEQTGIRVVDLSSTTRIDTLGLDSLDFIEMLQVIGEKLKPVPDEKIASLDTIGDILKAIE